MTELKRFRVYPVMGTNGLYLPIQKVTHEPALPDDLILYTDVRSIGQERDALKAKLAEVEKERDALRKVELPEITDAVIAALPDEAEALFVMCKQSRDLSHISLDVTWSPLSHAFVALLNKERGV